MKRGIFVALIVLATVSRASRAGGLLSPGPLATVHASIDTDNDCGKCHESGNQVVAKLCLDCHKDLGAELAARRGLHGKLYQGQGCENCHVEHLGRGARLVRWPGGTMEKLDHGLTGWPLEGGHTKPKCLDCHKKTSPGGKNQFVGTSTACAACHKDPHAGKLGADCQKCHAVREWQAFDRKAFDHKLARFELTGKHLDIACEKCHTGTPPKWKPLEFRACDACHQDPHRGQFKPKTCAQCHDTRSWEGATDAIRTNHPKLSLAAGHSRVACKTCHDRGNDKPPSKGSACASCHAPIHAAKFGNRCESCHASIKWVGLPEVVGRENHGKTRYALAGKHAEVACAGCHKPTRPQAQRFRGIEFGACAACHADVHNGEFVGLGGRKTNDCAACHTVAGYTPTRFGLAEHAATAFALDGKHAATPCTSCHAGPRPRLAFKVAAKQCADCHSNPHGTQFDKELQQGGCAHCHTASDWHQAKVDHSTWPLVGAHSRTRCAACHSEQKKGAEPAAYRGISRECEGCHDDVHAAQFTQTQPMKRCTACHSTESFQISAKFDHKTTRYPLEGKHLGLPCSECHKTETLRNGNTAVRWRLGYTQCKDCHASPHREAP